MIKQCLILVGGLGTRLGDLTRATPKPFLSVGERPFVEYLIFEAARRGFSSIVLLAGSNSAVVIEYAEMSKVPKQLGIDLRVLVEESPLGTGGALIQAWTELDREFIVLNGDTWFDFNWLDFVTKCQACGFSAGMALRSIESPDRYETVSVSGAQITSFVPRGANLANGLINAGVYYLKRDALLGLPAPSSLESDLFPRLVERRLLGGFCYDGFFIDIGLPGTYADAQKSVPSRMQRPAVFFDRDGVLNVNHGYVHKREEFEWMPGARNAIKFLNDLGYYVFVVTNQAGVAHGLYEEFQIKALHDWVDDELKAIGAHIDDWRHCPFHPTAKVDAYRQNHPWRKPNPGMIEDVFSSWPLDRANAFLVGDSASDLEAAHAAGIDGYLYRGENLKEFVSSIIASRK